MLKIVFLWGATSLHVPCFKPIWAKRAQNRGNVKDCVPLGATSLTFPLLKAKFCQNVLKTGEMLKMFDLIFEKMPKTGEMLKS